MRSVVVVLPASMWAMMPMFLQRSNGTCLDTAFFRSSFRDSCSLTTEPVKALPFSIFLSIPKETRLLHQLITKIPLPAIVRKGFVSLGHTMDVFFFLNRRAAAIGGVEQ